MKQQKPKITDICINIFSQNQNKPLYVDDIYSRMRQRHWKTNGKTPTQTIGSKLRADYRFIKVGPNTFKLDDTYYQARMKWYVPCAGKN
jgi:hypothetical protein